ncbi:hypothetical protein QKU48_gp0759 [Fadolivirus algeromassiliense]|jgi:hypothetical protein|uniref:Uncharacterized protein n=1 Tax=Fadolivirus FV1/VV64 TaxID=3070911 RepID=A0A7D3V8Y1_9VIRU|nr:hypothetical protein QKU48_gp0759 [Fadolivirus algeromassiliense]QKF94217.1 hypothetical protein Fadolivirus_1_759 [Fadolivirus FV1/VV64]
MDVFASLSQTNTVLPESIREQFNQLSGELQSSIFAGNGRDGSFHPRDYVDLIKSIAYIDITNEWTSSEDVKRIFNRFNWYLGKPKEYYDVNPQKVYVNIKKNTKHQERQKQTVKLYNEHEEFVDDIDMEDPYDSDDSEYSLRQSYRIRFRDEDVSETENDDMDDILYDNHHDEVSEEDYYESYVHSGIHLDRMGYPELVEEDDIDREYNRKLYNLYGFFDVCARNNLCLRCY